MSNGTTFTAKELAAACNTDGKTFRRFIRMQAAAGDAAILPACGQGNRYSIGPSEARALIAGFGEWRAGRRSHAPERSGADVLAMLSDDEGDDESESDEGDEGDETP